MKVSVNDLAEGTNVITATELDGSSATPGNEIPGMSDVAFDASNNIVLPANTKTLPTPIYLKQVITALSL
ncbi:MAG: hypothetical protein LUD46_12430 [Parabacteroides sp.]|nr:hypothetical protein [Parabacteroides sp.]